MTWLSVVIPQVECWNGPCSLLRGLVTCGCPRILGTTTDGMP